MIPLETIPERRADLGKGINLLEYRPVRALVRWPGFPYVFQAAMLVVFVMLAAIGWGRHAPEGVPDKLYAKANLATLLVWGLWWPAMVWIAVLLGRAWCMICPLELVSNVSERLGRGLGVKQGILTKWLRSGALIIALYALIQMLVAGVHLHRVPAYTSLFLWGLLATAGLVGFFLKDRAFCRGFCPVGLLLGTYGRGGMLAVRHDSTEQCEACTGKDCVRACNRERWQGRNCPSLLNPAKLNSNRDCLVCGQCIKACRPDNMRLLLRRLFHPSDTREPLASWPVTVFVMLVSGFVTGELCSEWPAAQAVFLWLPEQASRLLGLGPHNGWLEGAWMLVAYPLLLWLLLGKLARARGAASTTGEAWRRLALPLAVVIASGHMAKGLAKFASWVGFLPTAARDPGGDETALMIAGGTMASPAAILPLWLVSILGVVLIATGAYFALREARLAAPELSPRLRLPILTVAVLFAAVVSGWAAIR